MAEVVLVTTTELQPGAKLDQFTIVRRSATAPSATSSWPRIRPGARSCSSAPTSRSWATFRPSTASAASWRSPATSTTRASSARSSSRPIAAALHGHGVHRRRDAAGLLSPARSAFSVEKAVDFGRAAGGGDGLRPFAGRGPSGPQAGERARDADGKLVVTDFGVAFMAGARRLTWRWFSTALGTPDYMSPEQIQGKRGDARSDVYAIGVMLYEMLAGRVPWEGDNALSVMSQHINAPVPPLHEINSAVPPPIEGIVRKCLRKIPDERYEDANLARERPRALARPAAVAVHLRRRGRSRPPATPTRSCPADLRDQRRLPRRQHLLRGDGLPSRPCPRIAAHAPTEPRGRDEMPDRTGHRTREVPSERRSNGGGRSRGRRRRPERGGRRQPERRRPPAIERLLAAASGRRRPAGRAAVRRRHRRRQDRGGPGPPHRRHVLADGRVVRRIGRSRAWLARSSRTCTCAPIRRPSRSWSRPPECPARGSSARSSRRAASRTRATAAATLRSLLEQAESAGLNYLVAPEIEFFLFPRATRSGRWPTTRAATSSAAAGDRGRSSWRSSPAWRRWGSTSSRATTRSRAASSSWTCRCCRPWSRRIPSPRSSRRSRSWPAKRGMQATFMPKPLADAAGSRACTPTRSWSIDAGRSVFDDPTDAYGLSAIAKAFLAGQLEHAPGMCALVAPVVNSYKRLVPGYEAPVAGSWGRHSRGALIRVPTPIRQASRRARSSRRAWSCACPTRAATRTSPSRPCWPRAWTAWIAAASSDRRSRNSSTASAAAATA
jgi:hypothetical protein